MRRLGAWLLGAATVLPLVACSPDDERGQNSRGEPARPPNILIAVTDDQRTGMLSVMPATRNRFVREGTSFTRAYVTTPLCCPSRASIYTGQYAHNHGVRQNNDGLRMDQDASIMASLQRAGYLTAMTGKYLTGFRPELRDPPYFDRWAVFVRPRYFDARYNVNGRIRRITGYSTDVIADRSVRILHAFERQDDRPWFLFVSPWGPHKPAKPHPKDAGVEVPGMRITPAMRETDRSDKPPHVRMRDVDLRTMRVHRRRQLRALPSVDRMIDGIFATLDDLSEDRNTLAFFISDNGEQWGEHDLRSKRFPYRESVRVPLMTRWPGRVTGGARDARLVTNLDIVPTIIDATGIETPAPPDGMSLLSNRRREELLLEFYRDVAQRTIPSWTSILTPRFQYIEYRSGGRITFREYYRLRNDPWQLENVLRDGNDANDPSRRRIRHLHRRLARYRACSGDVCP